MEALEAADAGVVPHDDSSESIQARKHNFYNVSHWTPTFDGASAWDVRHELMTRTDCTVRQTIVSFVCVHAPMASKRRQLAGRGFQEVPEGRTIVLVACVKGQRERRARRIRQQGYLRGFPRPVRVFPSAHLRAKHVFDRCRVDDERQLAFSRVQPRQIVNRVFKHSVRRPHVETVIHSFIRYMSLGR